MIASPFMHLDKDYAYFKDLLLRHCVQRPPYSQFVFTLKQMKEIQEYVTTT